MQGLERTEATAGQRVPDPAHLGGALEGDPRITPTPYMARNGWLSLRLDEHTDWDEARDLLRHSYRENGQVKNETVGNLSHLPEPVVELIRKALHGEILAPVTSIFEILSSSPQGHVQAVLTTLRPPRWTQSYLP